MCISLNHMHTRIALIPKRDLVAQSIKQLNEMLVSIWI